MPKAKRDKLVPLTKTTKLPPALSKQNLAQHVRTTALGHNFIYIYTISNMRNARMKSVRYLWSDSRFYMGKTKIMQIGLGLTPETECAPNLHQLTKLLDSQSGVFFTSRPVDQVLSWFRYYKENDYACSGNVAAATVKLNAGPIPDFSHSMENHLRSLGLPTRLDCSKIILDSDYVVCTRGDVLTPNQAKILKLLHIKLAMFRVTLKCYWSRFTGEVTFPPVIVYNPVDDQLQDYEMNAVEGPPITYPPEPILAKPVLTEMMDITQILANTSNKPATATRDGDEDAASFSE